MKLKRNIINPQDLYAHPYCTIKMNRHYVCDLKFILKL